MDKNRIQQEVAKYLAENRARLIRELMQPSAHRRALSAQEAEDAIQDAWRTLQRKIEDGTFAWRDGRISAFVDEAVELAARNLARRIGRRKDKAPVEGVLKDETVEPAAAAGGADDPVAASQARQREQLVKEAIDKLLPERKEVVRLKFFDGRSWSEIAKMLATTVSVVRTIAKNALVDLQGLLPAEGHLAESGELLHVVLLDLAGDIHRLPVALRPRPITDEDGQLTFRLLAPMPGAVPPPHAFALLRLDDGEVVYGARPAAVHLRQDQQNREAWLAQVDVRRLDGNRPSPGSVLAGIWVFALPKAPPGDLGRVVPPAP